MPHSTLALGQASYQLLDELDENSKIVETIRAQSRGGLIDQLSVGVAEGFAFGGGALVNIQSLNIVDRTRGLLFNDSDISLVDVAAFNDETDGIPLSSAGSNANINILANAHEAEFGLGSGDNRLNAARDLTDSTVSAERGDDTVRIGGATDGTFVNLGAGDDHFTAGRGARDLDVDMGAGDDTALFLGTLQAGTGPSREYDPVIINNDSIIPKAAGSNLINMGDGNDLATFLGGIRGGDPGTSGYEIQLGAGDDEVVFGRGSTSDGFVLNTGIGNDTVNLGRVTVNAVIDLGWDDGGTTVPESGDSVILGAGAELNYSGIRSGQSFDTLQIAGTISDTSLDLGGGESLVKVDGAAVFGSTDAITVWDLGSGDDQLIFGWNSTLEWGGVGTGLISLGEGEDYLELSGSGDGGSYGSIEIDLGNDGDSDTIVFGLDYFDSSEGAFTYSGFTISNFGFNDILYIGYGSYGYGYSFLNELANDDHLLAFQAAGNVIWSQAEDSDLRYQEIMTLDEELIKTEVPMTDDDGEPILDNDTGEIVMIDIEPPSDDLISSFDVDEWTAAGNAPMSSYDPVPEPIFPDQLNLY